MALLKFQFQPPDLVSGLPELRSAYLTGLDRTPQRTAVEVRPGLLVCQSESPESARLNVAWPVPGHGAPVLTTATLAERKEPYNLAVELARGRLNDLRNQAADWRQVGLSTDSTLDELMRQATETFAQAATRRDEPAAATAAAQRALQLALTADARLIASYTEQVLARRKGYSQRLPTLLGCGIDAATVKAPGAAVLKKSVNAARIACDWKRLQPNEGKYRWEEIDAQLQWCQGAGLAVTAGPLLDFHGASLPDWLWLWESDFEPIHGMVEELIRAAITRYRGRVTSWQIAHRTGTGRILGLTEEEQIRIAARAIQVARRADPDVPLFLGVERPWAGWLATSTAQFGPLHLADSLARADLGLSGLAIELALGYTRPGSQRRDLLDVSRLLDLYALVNLPLSVTIAVPSSGSPDPKAEANVALRDAQWAAPPDEASQRDLLREVVSLAVAKPYVQSVEVVHAADAAPHLFPHAGLLRPDGKPKAAAQWMADFRAAYLN
jgi:hypothetical protein